MPSIVSILNEQLVIKPFTFVVCFHLQFLMMMTKRVTVMAVMTRTMAMYPSQRYVTRIYSVLGKKTLLICIFFQVYNDDLEEDNSDWEEGEGGGDDDEDEDSDIDEADGDANESAASVNANAKDGEKPGKSPPN